MIYVSREGDLLKTGLHFYPLKSSSFGFKLVWKRKDGSGWMIGLRYSKDGKYWHTMKAKAPKTADLPDWVRALN